MSNPFAGVWTYRSFLNNPVPVGDDPKKLEALLFAEGVWTVKDSPATIFEGELSFGPGNIMDLKGDLTPAHDGVAAHAHIVGKGRPGTSTEHLFYDYAGSLTEHWPDGVNQVPAIMLSAFGLVKSAVA